MNHNKRCKFYFQICALPSFTISPVLLLLFMKPPTRIILSLIWTAACPDLSWLKRDWEKARWLVLTSMLRSESIHLAHCAKRCKKCLKECLRCLLRTRPAAVRCQRQRGSGSVSLGRRIRGWEGSDVTWCRKKGDIACGQLSRESFNADLS